jgi:hypothetical protein
MKKLAYLVIHCTATPESREVTAADITRWHTSPKPAGRGWKKVGYTDLIMTTGELVNLTPFDQDDDKEAWEITNGVAGINEISHHIVYAGGTDSKGKPKDTRTPRQQLAMADYVRYAVTRWPKIKVAGHNQFDPGKACPSFDVPKWLRSLNIPERNIYAPAL